MCQILPTTLPLYLHSLGDRWKETRSQMLTTAQNVATWARKQAFRGLFWGCIGLSALLYSQAFFMGVTWGLFLCSFDVAVGEGWAQSAPRFQVIPQNTQATSKSYLGMGGVVFLGTVLFHGYASFLVGWTCGEAVSDLLGRRVEKLVL